MSPRLYMFRVWLLPQAETWFGLCSLGSLHCPAAITFMFPATWLWSSMELKTMAHSQVCVSTMMYFGLSMLFGLPCGSCLFQGLWVVFFEVFEGLGSEDEDGYGVVHVEDGFGFVAAG